MNSLKKIKLFTYFVEPIDRISIICYHLLGDNMELIFSNNTLYINIEERINFTLISKLQKKLYRIIDTYHISNIEISILNDSHYDRTLIQDLINDYRYKYNGKLIVK